MTPTKTQGFCEWCGGEITIPYTLTFSATITQGGDVVSAQNISAQVCSVACGYALAKYHVDSVS